MVSEARCELATSRYLSLNNILKSHKQCYESCVIARLDHSDKYNILNCSWGITSLTRNSTNIIYKFIKACYTISSFFHFFFTCFYIRFSVFNHTITIMVGYEGFEPPTYRWLSLPKGSMLLTNVKSLPLYQTELVTH